MDIDTNAAEIAARLEKLATRIKTPRDLITAAVLIVERQTKARTPVDTGTLRRSITHRLLSASSAQVGTTVEYARFVHDGTRFMRGRPFLEQGLSDSRMEIDALVRRFGAEVFGG